MDTGDCWIKSMTYMPFPSMDDGPGLRDGQSGVMLGMKYKGRRLECIFL